MSSERADALHAALVKQVRSLRSSEEWIEAMAKAAMFHQYSFGNWLLLAAQADSRGTTVTRPAGYRAWQRLGRNVKKGERGYQILAPMIRRTKRDSDDERDGVIVTGFRVVTVFDVSQTDGDALPDVGPRHLEGFDPPDLFDAVVSLLEADGFSFELAELAGPNGTTSPLLRRGVVDSRLGESGHRSRSWLTSASTQTRRSSVVAGSRWRPNRSRTSCALHRAWTPRLTRSPTWPAGRSRPTTRSRHSSPPARRWCGRLAPSSTSSPLIETWC